MVRTLRHRFYLLAAVAGLTLFAGLVFANAVPVPVGISPVAAAPSGLQSVVTFDARGAPGAANAGYYSRPVLVSNNTLGGVAKGMVRRAAPVAAMSAAIAAAGWAIDELTGQVMDGESVDPPGPVAPGAYFYYYSAPYSSQSAAEAALRAANQSAVATVHRHSSADSGPDHERNLAYCVHHEAWSSGQHLALTYITRYQNQTAFPQPYPWADVVTQPSPVPDAALGQLVKDNPGLWEQALRNPDGSVNRNPDVQAAAQALAAELAAGAPVPDPTAEWDSGYQGGDPQPQAGGDFELPAFCDWAGIVCEAITWAQDDEDDAPTDQPIDWIDAEAAVTWDSGLGGGSCPADASASLPVFGEVVFPMGQFCTGADMIRPLILLAAAFIAAMIIGGYRSAA